MLAAVFFSLLRPDAGPLKVSGEQDSAPRPHSTAITLSRYLASLPISYPELLAYEERLKLSRNEQKDSTYTARAINHFTL